MTGPPEGGGVACLNGVVLIRPRNIGISWSAGCRCAGIGVENENVELAHDLALKTEDAYSYEAYKPGAWERAIRVLLNRGWTPLQVETIMRSKWTRWARDTFETRWGHATSGTILRYIDAAGDAAARETADKYATM